MFESGVIVLRLQSHSDEAVIAETEDAVRVAVFYVTNTIVCLGTA